MTKTRKIIFFVLAGCFLMCSTVHSQEQAYQIKFSHEIESELANEELRFGRAGFEYALIGEYYRATTFSDIPVSWGVDTLDLSQYQLADALPSILSEAKKHQVVIISENHLKPQHRIFAKRIIEGLRDLGFSHMGFETFSSTKNENTPLDSNLVKRGYPLNSYLTGTYTLEPNMGKLVRHAIALDFKLFAYERSEKIKGKDRDEIQAANVFRYLKNNPSEKVILFCGFHHAIESDLQKYGRINWMAKELKEISGIDPLTIYQDNFTEKFTYDQHEYLSEVRVTSPSVFVSNDGDLVRLTNHVDIEVIHPLTQYVKGRPNWLYEDSTFRAVEIEVENKEMDYPIIASVFPLKEENSVPVDRLELGDKYDTKYFVLKDGEYRIELINSDTKEVYSLKVEQGQKLDE